MLDTVAMAYAHSLRIPRAARPLWPGGVPEAMIRRALLTAVAAALALPGAASAQWSPPQTESTARLSSPPTALFTGGGQAFVSVGDGTFLTYASNRIAQFQRVSHGLTTELVVRFGGVGEGLGKPRVLAPGHDVQGFSAATDARGNMVVAIVRNVRDAKDSRIVRKRVVEVVQRAAGGSFGTPSTIVGKGSPTAVGAAVGRNAERFVAYERAGGLEVRRRESGHGWTTPQLLSYVVKGHTQIAAAAGADGTAAVAWLSQNLTEGGDNGPATYRMAVRDARGHNFHSARLLENFSNRLPQGAGIDVAVASDGTGVAGWTGRAEGHFVARVADLRGAPQTLSPLDADAVLGGVDVAPGGEAAAVWAPPLDTPSPQVFAAVRAAGAGAFGAPEAVSPAYREVVGPDVAVDPQSGRVLAAWLARTGATTQAVLSSLRASP
jgi:hypothetical protein